jgi:hypothetical protein
MTDSTPSDVQDVRLYVTDSTEWTAHIKEDSAKLYCYQKNPGEDFFHLIVDGEIYLAKGDEKYCLRCALRDGVATTDRLFWQNRVTKRKSEPM